MKKDKNSEKNMKIVCMILLSIFLVITGIFIACKCAFSRKDTESDVSSDTVIETKDTGFELNIQELEKMAQDPEKGKNLIIPGENDRRVIPDKYNTGCQGDLVKIQGETEINGITVTYSSGNFVFDFFYRNKNISGTVIIENYDFSEHSVVVYNEKSVKGKNIKLVFKNCNFYGFNNGRPESDVFSYEFDNCSFKIFQGSNAVFNKCRFGGSYNDGLIPFSNVTVKDCYFSDFASANPKGNGQHTDGTQMFGYSDSMVKNVLFSNCRFETPQVKMTSSTAYVNACIMLSLEFNNGNNIKIENCILNGGGYSIYAQKKKELTLTDVSFNNIKIGDAKIYGSIYPHCDDNVVFTNVGDQKYLYVSSVWNDDSKTHIIVSNDTAEERTLRVVTGSSSKDFTIGACPGGDKLKNDNYDKPFEDFPFDIDISIDKTDDYVICFDVTDGYEDRIRYVSFDGNPTYYAAKINETPVGLQESDNKVMDPIEGSCGKDITY